MMQSKLPSFATWKALSAALFLVVLVQHFSKRVQWSAEHSFPSLPWPQEETWEYEANRDRYNYGLSSDRCHSAFPNLYKEVDRAVAQWQGRPITPETIKLVDGNDGNVRLMIHDNQVRIIATKGLYRDDFNFRILSLISQVRRAVIAVDESLPNIEFNIVVDDIVSLRNHPNDRALWGFNRQNGNKVHDNIWVIPDFIWFAGRHQGNFHDMQDRSRAYDSGFQQKIPKVVWRGPTWNNPGIRKALINATEGESWADVEAMVWEGDKSNVMEVEEFCKYAFLVHTEGSAWSGRLTFILNCDSVPVVHDLKWTAHYYHLMEPGVNVVRVERRFTDLKDKIQYYLANPKEAQAIADKSVATFRDRYTSPAATACYWRELFKGWSEVSFTPELYETTKGGEQKMRGISYEDFINKTIHGRKTE